MEDRECEICGASLLETRGSLSYVTCSPQCAKDYGVVRNLLSQEQYEKHARARAKTVLAKPDDYPDEMIRWAKRLMAGEIVPKVEDAKPRKGSKRYKVAKRLGLI